jgi:Ca2+-binding RTX toxin-like protein
MDPRGHAQTFAGTGADDQFGGTVHGDVLSGGAGTDRLWGYLGNDRLDGGLGADILSGGMGDDTFLVDNASDLIEEAFGGGRDTVLASNSYALAVGAEVEVMTLSGVSSKVRADLTGSDFANAVTGHGGTNWLKGQGGDDVLKASSGNDRVYGGMGNDKLHGGSGHDRLYGEGGRDTFVFDTRPSKSTNVDRIYGYRVKDDIIQLENGVFTKLGKGSTKGVKLKADMFVTGKKAQDAEDRIVYDKASGALYYDQDGTGSRAQVKIATLDKNLKITQGEFFVI